MGWIGPSLGGKNKAGEGRRGIYGRYFWIAKADGLNASERQKDGVEDC
jgi:hypothetical protein